MPFTVTMPKLSPTMEAGVIAKWHKKEGEKVESGDVLLEVTTDKATVEHAALDDGYLRKIIVQEGSSASINQAIAIFTEEESESIEGYEPEGQKVEEEKPEEVSQKPSEEKTETNTKPQAATANMAQPEFIPEPPLENYRFEYPQDSLTGKIMASPLAKKIAKEKGLDLSTVKGSGPGGRVMSEDVSLAQGHSAAQFGLNSAPTIAPGTYVEENLNAIQSVIASRLQSSKTFIPHFYLHQDINVTKLVELRSQLANQNIKVSYNDFVLRATALALKQHPNVNSGYNSKNNTLIRFKTVDISIAVSLEGGLITPIVRHADYKNLGQLSSEVKVLAKKARSGKLSIEEFKGGSFTISNLGMFGTTDVLPVINPPQAGILGVGGIAKIPMVIDDQILMGYQMKVTLAADHRVVNGEDGAKFLKTLRGILENPAVVLI